MAMPICKATLNVSKAAFFPRPDDGNTPLTYPQITRALLGVKLWLHRNHYKVRVIITEIKRTIVS